MRREAIFSFNLVNFFTVSRFFFFFCCFSFSLHRMECFFLVFFFDGALSSRE